MTEEIEGAVQEPKKPGKKGLLIGIVLMCAAAGGGYYVTSTGLFPAAGETAEVKDPKDAKAVSVAFVAMPPLVVSLGPNAAHQLRFQAQFEVSPDHSEDVTMLMPRIQDVLNGYLRAVDYDVLREPSSLIRLRAQMLRRVQLVAGQNAVQDLLITEFVFG